MVFANTPFFANGMQLLPEATPFDGRLHCCSIRTRSLSHSLLLSRRIRDGSHVEQDEVEIIPDTAFRVTPARGRTAIQYDGEVLTGVEHLKISVLPAALRVVDTAGG
jgi:diacylglycerol kinase family enzyme